MGVLNWHFLLLQVALLLASGLSPRPHSSSCILMFNVILYTANLCFERRSLTVVHFISLTHCKENLAAAAIKLTAEDIDFLN